MQVQDLLSMRDLYIYSIKKIIFKVGDEVGASGFDSLKA